MALWTDTLARLFASHRGRLEAFLARRTRDPQAAADLTQEAFLRMARLPDGDKVQDPQRFLFTVAGNLARDHRRQSLRQGRLDGGPPDEALASPEPDAERQAAARQEFDRLRAALAALPERTREVFLLHRVEELRYAEIGERLGISPRTVEYHLRQALQHCRQALADERPPGESRAGTSKETGSSGGKDS